MVMAVDGRAEIICYWCVSIYNTSITFVMGDIKQPSFTIVNFSLFYEGTR